MIKKLTLCIGLSIGIIGSMLGQQSLYDADPDNISYKKALKKAAKENRPILAILYSPDRPSDVSNDFKDLHHTITSSGYIPVVIDWVKAPNKSPQKYVSPITNPAWLIIHHDEVILSAYKSFNSEESLRQVLSAEKETFTKVDEAYQKQSKSRDLGEVLSYAEVISDTYDTHKTAELVEQFLKGVDMRKLNSDVVKKILSMWSEHTPSRQLNKLVNLNRNKAIELVGKEKVLNIQQAYILHDLKRNGILEPFYVWERYEKELGTDADSSYRIFALSYLMDFPSEREMFYNEMFDYVMLYPNSPWELLDPLYGRIIPQTTKEEDLEILLELVSYQISRESSFKALDYKAYLLYKLDQKERALSMVNDIMADAQSKGINYQSMLRSLKN